MAKLGCFRPVSIAQLGRPVEGDTFTDIRFCLPACLPARSGRGVAFRHGGEVQGRLTQDRFASGRANELTGLHGALARANAIGLPARTLSATQITIYRAMNGGPSPGSRIRAGQ